jgi:hypothetical protein
MSIKPVLVPDHTANDLRRLMDHFADATTGPVKRQLTESVESAESLSEFAPPDSGDGGGDDDGFDEATLRKLAAQWFAGDEDPQVERLLAAAGWEIGQDEGYEDEPGVFVVMSGDDDGRSYMSWPAEELRSDVAETRPDVEEGINEDLSPEIKKLNKTYKKLFSIIAYDKNGKKLMSGPKAHKEVSRQLGVDPDDMDEYLRLEYYDFFDTVNKEWEKQKGNRKEHYSNEIYGKVDEDPTKIKEARPDVMRHGGDTTVKVVKRGGKPIGEIGIDAEASAGNGAYYVKLYDGTYDAAGFDTAEEALAELRYAIKQMSEGVSEDAAANNPVVNAITRRIVLQRTDLLSKYGPELVGQAVDEVADFVGDVEEIGSSDVSGWVRHVEQMLGNRESDVAEQQVDELSPKTLGSYIKKSSADAAERTGEVSGRNQFGKGAEFAVKAFYGDRIQPNPTRTDPRIAKRQAGVDQAVDRLTAEDVAPAFKPGDRVMYLNGFATVVAQDGDAYGIRIDGKPGTQMVPADQIRKPSYDESVAESIDPVEQLRADIRRFAL